jgi:hypothetical protein
LLHNVSFKYFKAGFFDEFVFIFGRNTNKYTTTGSKCMLSHISDVGVGLDSGRRASIMCGLDGWGDKFKGWTGKWEQVSKAVKQKKKKKDNAFLLLSSYAPAFSFNIEVPQ